MKPLYNWIALINDKNSNQTISDLQSILKKMIEPKNLETKKKESKKVVLVGRKKTVQYIPTEAQTSKVFFL
jgi:hypothetical protein